MKRTILHSALAIVFTLIMMNTTEAQFIFPKTDQHPVVDTLHGYYLTDPYRWLEDKDNLKVQKWSRAQHEATLDYVNGSYPDVPGLRDEIQAYIDRDIISPMQLVADRQFYTVRKKGDKQAKLYTRISLPALVLLWVFYA